MRRKLVVRIALSVAVVAGLGFAVANLDVHPAEIVATIRRIGPVAGGIALLAVIVQMSLVLTRLWFLFPSPRPRWARVAYGFTLGQVVNNFLPIRSGDAIKVVIISGPAEVTGRFAAETAGVLIADALIDVVALVLLFLVVGPGDVVSLGGGVWSRAAIVGGALALLVAALWVGRGNVRVRRVLRGVQVLRDPRKLLGGLALSSGNWFAEVLALRVLTAELGGACSVADAIRVLFLLNLGIVVPVSVANVGTFEVPIALGLRATGLAFAEGLAIGTAYHGLQILGIAVLAVTASCARRAWPSRFTPS